MAILLHFVKDGTNEEYVVIHEDEEAETSEFAKPGFTLRAQAEILGDASGMPTDRTLTPEG